jgi:hypothetical protein
MRGCLSLAPSKEWRGLPQKALFVPALATLLLQPGLAEEGAGRRRAALMAPAGPALYTHAYTHRHTKQPPNAERPIWASCAGLAPRGA